MAEGETLAEACEQARILWAAYNKVSGGSRARIEVFIRTNGLRMAIMPGDASMIAKEEGVADTTVGLFSLDDRISECPNQMVFKESETKLPSAWYTTTPTPPTPERAAAA